MVDKNKIMNIFKIFFAILVITQICCLDNNKKEQNPENNTLPPFQRDLLLSTEDATIADPNGKFTNGCLLFNTTLSNYYADNLGKVIPKAPHLTDDPKSRMFSIPDFLVVAKLEPALRTKLPAKLQSELGQHKLDIFWVVQNSANLGEKEDHNNIPTTTRLKPHAWADPNALTTYSGTRVNRDFLMGIFDFEHDISTANFPLENMTASPVHTHDGLFSPRPPTGTNMLKVGYNDNSQSFWSLVIDSNNSPENIRAVATLHWILKWSENEEAELRKITKKYEHKSVTFKDFLIELNKSNIFKNTEMLKKLNLLSN